MEEESFLSETAFRTRYINLRISLSISTSQLTISQNCQLVKVAPEDRGDSRCFNEPECEQICDFVDTQVWNHAMIREELIGA